MDPARLWVDHEHDSISDMNSRPVLPRGILNAPELGYMAFGVIPEWLRRIRPNLNAVMSLDRSSPFHRITACIHQYHAGYAQKGSAQFPLLSLLLRFAHGSSDAR